MYTCHVIWTHRYVKLYRHIDMSSFFRSVFSYRHIDDIDISTCHVIWTYRYVKLYRHIDMSLFRRVFRYRHIDDLDI